MSPSWPTMPTAAAATARFCGESILPSTPAEEFVAAISTGLSPAWSAAVACSRPNSEFDEVSDPVIATPIQPMSGDSSANSAAGGGQCEAEALGLPGEVHHEGQGEHRGDGDDREPQLTRVSPVGAQRLARRDPVHAP